MPNELLSLKALSILTYLVGSIPFGFIMAHLFIRQDIRSIGSGNSGATNVARTAGKLAGILTLLGDLLKGALPTLYIIHHAPLPWAQFIPLLAILGHCYSPFLGFKGGKGVATTLGVLLVLEPLFFGVMLGLFISIVFLTQLVSVASILSILLTFITSLMIHSPVNTSLLLGFLSLFILIRHHENLSRLLKGVEAPFKAKT